MVNGFPYFHSNTQEQVNSQDTLQFNANFSISTPGVGSSTAFYHSKDSLGDCFNRSLTAADQKLTSVTDSKACNNQDP